MVAFFAVAQVYEMPVRIGADGAEGSLLAV
jgi:hypothetical protein